MDTDGLLSAGEKLDQVTWMDVRIGEILPTPRHGKPVEINAYWYNALCIMDEFVGMLQKPDRKKAVSDYAKMARQTKQSFREKFWSAKLNCLKDVISGTAADEQIRCNQIWAVSLPFTMLDKEQERQIVDTVFEKLYTPYGLRTLDPADAQFHGKYGGSQMERDLAYHQGTVWVFPLGAYYLAYLKKEIMKKSTSKGSKAAENSGKRAWRRMYRAAAGDLRWQPPVFFQRMLCAGVECGRNIAGVWQYSKRCFNGQAYHSLVFCISV